MTAPTPPDPALIADYVRRFFRGLGDLNERTLRLYEQWARRFWYGR